MNDEGDQRARLDGLHSSARKKKVLSHCEKKSRGSGGIWEHASLLLLCATWAIRGTRVPGSVSPPTLTDRWALEKSSVVVLAQVSLTSEVLFFP